MARKYDHEYKVQAVKLAKEIGGAKAAKELGIPEGTIHTWLKAVRAGKLDIGEGSHTPASAMSLSEEITMLRKFDCSYTNGYTEGTNNAIKVIKRNAFGYRNFDNFRNRIFLSLT